MGEGGSGSVVVTASKGGGQQRTGEKGWAREGWTHG